MKNQLIILMILLSVSRIDAQYSTVKKSFSEPVKIIALYTGSIILDAAGDALNDSNHKDWGHLCCAASVGILLTSPFIIDYDRSKWGWYLTTYVSLRIALFDYAYNISRDLPLNYIGTTSNWDKMTGGMKSSQLSICRCGALAVGISVPITKLSRDNRPGIR
jgi:hypothetical protein